MAWAVLGLATTMVAGTAFLVYRTMQGRIPFDIGVGRTVVRLSPRTVLVRARRPMLFEMLRSAGQARGVRHRDRVEVLERSGDLIVARLRTDTGRGVTSSVEAARFFPGERVTYRHLLGPFPYALEEFVLREVPGGTELEHRGEFAVDLWWLGRLAARLYIKRAYERLVDEHMAAIKEAAEARAARSRVHPMPGDASP